MKKFGICSVNKKRRNNSARDTCVATVHVDKNYNLTQSQYELMLSCNYATLIHEKCMRSVES